MMTARGSDPTQSQSQHSPRHDDLQQQQQQQAAAADVDDGDNKKIRSNLPSLVSAFMASLTTGGTVYAFGLYAAALKHQLHLSQAELDTISSAFFFAGLFSWIPGLCADRFGTKISQSCGGLLGMIALLLYWSVARQFLVIHQKQWLVLALSVLGISIYMSGALVTGSVFKTIMSRCGPGTKGSAVGAAKGYVGLGSGLYSCIFEKIRRPGESDLDFLPMAGLFFVVCASMPAALLLPTKQQAAVDTFVDDATPRHFQVLYAAIGIIATIIVTTSLFSLEKEHAAATSPERWSDENLTNVKHEGPHYGSALLLISMWLGPILIMPYLPRDNKHWQRMLTAIPTEDPGDYHHEQGPDTAADDEDNNYHDQVGHHENDLMLTSARETDSNRLGHSLSQRRISGSPTVVRKSVTVESVNRSRDHTGVVEIRADIVNDELLLDDDGMAIVGNHFSDSGSSITMPTAVLSSPSSLHQPVTTVPDLNLIQMLQTAPAMLMLWSTTILVGAGTVVTNNMGQMVESLGFHPAVTPASLALFSVAQAASRVVTGAVSEAALSWKASWWMFGSGRSSSTSRCGIPRPYFLVLAALMGFLAHAILAVARQELVFVLGSTLAGAAFGMVWPLMVLMSGEVFGTAHVGANYMFFDGFTSAIGTLVLSKLVAQHVYEGNIHTATAPDPFTCIGTACFAMTHAVVALLCLTCVASSLCMVWTTRHVYRTANLPSTSPLVMSASSS